MRDFVNSAEVAEMLGLALSTFRSKKRQLQRLGFPDPIPWNSRLWRREAVEAFIATGGAQRLEGGNVTVHPAARQAAARRIAERVQ